MTKEQLDYAIEQIYYQDDKEAEYRTKLSLEIIRLQELRTESSNKNTYQLVYKKEYGPYKEFVRLVSDALRKNLNRKPRANWHE